MEKIACFREKFEDIIEEVLNQDLSIINTHELGEVVDMLKDICETEYYRTVVETMVENSSYENSEYINKYIPETSIKYYAETEPSDFRSRMYYNVMNEHDDSEGKAGLTRKTFIEMDDNGASKDALMKTMDQYIKDIGDDISEMIEDFDTNEKAIVKQRVATLASKIA